MGFRIVPADLVVSGKFRGAYSLSGEYMQSPNYVHGVSGWSIFGDGSAEFNDLTLRGTFYGADFEINTSGAFFYSPTPGAGNLIASIAAAAGTDEYGNAYEAGITTYTAAGWLKLLSGGASFSDGSLIGSNGGQLKLTPGADLNNFLQLMSGQIWAGTPLVATDPVTGTRPATWTAVTLSSGWGAGGDINGASYAPSVKLLPDGSIAIRGALSTPSAAFSLPAQWGTAPAGYVNTQSSPPTCPVVQGNGNHAGVVAIKSNGSLWLDGNFSTSEDVFLDGTLRVT